MKLKIAIVGAPSCRKTTSAERLVSELKLAGYNAIFCGEFARDYIAETGIIENPFEQLYVTEQQILIVFRKKSATSTNVSK